MADVNANIGVNIDSSQALAQLKALQRQISEFHSSVAKSSEAAALAQKSLQKNLVSSINSIGAFSAELRTVNTTAESFTKALENNKLSMREYFRFAGAATKTFGNNFKSELDTISKVAEERVKTLQTQYIKMGRDANGAMKAIAVRPLVLDMNDLSTKTQIAAQKQAIFNQLMKQGSTNLLNFGKNTQWAGRQLMVGFTLPLAAFGATAAKAFQTLETEVIKFRKVYGDLGTSKSDTDAALKNIKSLADAYTQYGVEVSKTVGVASQAAAAGFQGADLIAQTDAATKLAILGQIDQQQALETTISLQNAFKISSTELASTIDFLNAVENQTVTSLDDITIAIPKVAPVIQSLGGDVKDLAFFLTAMKEGGVNASEGANALKSGLASLINPSKKANAMLAGMGINIDNIVNKNQGNLKATVVEFAKALDTLDPLARARAIETMFGKFQFARISTLLSNVIQSGNQASRVLDLAGQSTSDLASLTSKELGITAQSALVRFQAATAKLRASLAPVGEVFMKAFVPVLDFISGLLDKFNGLGDGTKKFIAITAGVIGGLGPILLMTFGLLANGIANILKLFMTLRNGFQRLTGQSQNLGEQTQYLTMEQLDAAAAAHSLEQSHARLTQQFNVEAGAVNQLRTAYQSAIAAGASFASLNPGMMKAPRKFANGGVVVSGPGGPKDDMVPANLSNGEVVLSVDTVKKNQGIVSGLLSNRRIKIPGYAVNPGSVAGGAPGMGGLGKGFKNATMYLPESWNTAMGGSGKGVPTSQVSNYISQGGSAVMAPLMAVMAKQMGVSLNSPQFQAEWARIGDKFAAAAATALNNSGLEFIKDEHLEEIVVPALKETAKGLNIVGKEVSTSLNSAITEIHTVGQVGTQSGAKGGAGRTAISRFSYRNIRENAQQFAMERMPSMFARNTRVSSSGKIKNTFQTLNPVTQQWEVATMAHITKSITTTVKDLINRTTPYLGDMGAKITKATSKGIIDGAEKSLKINSPSLEAENVGDQAGTGFKKGIEKVIPQAVTAGEKIADSVVAGSSQSKRTKGKGSSKRPQGAAPLLPPPGAIMLPIVAPLTADEKKQQAARDRKARIKEQSRLKFSGGGMMAGAGLMAGSMALNALPEFTGKAMVQSTMNMASMGSMFGPWGAAAGAAVGLVTSALGSLIEKEKEQKAMQEAVFKPSAELATYFGNAVVDTDASVSHFNVTMGSTALSAGNLGKSFGFTTAELKAFTDLISSLPENNPLKEMITGLTNEKNAKNVEKTAKAFIATQVAIGQIKTDQAQKALDLMLSASGHAGMIGNTFVNFKNQTEAVSKTLRSAAGNTKTFGDTLVQLIAAASNSTSLEQMNSIIIGITNSGLNGAAALNALMNAYLGLGNTSAANGVATLRSIEGMNANNISYILTAVNAGLDLNLKVEKGIIKNKKWVMKQAKDFLNKKGTYGMQQSEGAKDPQVKTLEVQNLSLSDRILILEEEKRLIDNKLKKEKSISDEFKRQNDYLSKQQDLNQKIVQAKMSGNYIEAANLQQEKMSNTTQFNYDTKVGELQKQSDDLGQKISDLKDKTQTNNEAMSKLTGSVDKLGVTIDAWKPGKIETDQGKKVDPIKIAAGTAFDIGNGGGKKDLGKAGAAWEGIGKYSDRQYIKKYAEGMGWTKTPGTFFYTTIGNAKDKTLRYDEFVVLEDGNIQRVKENLKNPPKLATGGQVQHFEPGGGVRGPGTATSDSIPAYLSNGEYVIKSAAVNQYGKPFFDSLNAQKFADGGSVKKDGWLQKWAKSISGKPGSEMMGTAPLLRLLAGLGGKKDVLGAAQVPLSFAGAGIGPKILGNLGKSAYYLPNKINQFRNQRKVSSMIKSGMWHGSQPLGHRGEEYLQGTNILDFAESYDPHYGMGFFGTSSKAEADLYASGYNSSSNWGASFGSMNNIVGAPKGKYVDFTKGTNSLKWQDYALAKALGVKKNGYIGSYMPENLGDIMSGEGMTGAIMNRINTGHVPKDIAGAKWLAWNNPAGVITKEKFAMGGMVPKFHNWNGVVPGQYGQELNAVLKSGTEGVYQNQYIAGLKNAASGNSSTSNSNSVYNIDMTINGGGTNANEIADQVMRKLKVISSQNNRTNKVAL